MHPAIFVLSSETRGYVANAGTSVRLDTQILAGVDYICCTQVGSAVAVTLHFHMHVGVTQHPFSARVSMVEPE